ncbi:hypothetical protein [Streptomyces sp. NPDC048644]|uniref:hypothetical protein n=1 Tax=Streptomyces sp. NPDC048644 TaxID=3365582 RepID=UPI003721A222
MKDPVLYASPTELLADTKRELDRKKREAKGSRVRLIKRPRQHQISPEPPAEKPSAEPHPDAPPANDARPAPPDPAADPGEKPPLSWWEKLDPRKKQEESDAVTDRSDDATSEEPETARETTKEAAPSEAGKGKEQQEEASRDTAGGPETSATGEGDTAASEEEESPPAARRSVTSNPRFRALVFNGVAAGVGYGTGLVQLIGRLYPIADESPVIVISIALAAIGVYAGWRLVIHSAVTAIIPDFLFLISFFAVPIAMALFGLRLTSAVMPWLIEDGSQFGFGPSTAALLVSAIGTCGGLWWLLDRRTRAWHWTARIVVRVPLASALLATALYAPGTLLF